MKQEPLKIIYRNYGIADAFPDGVVELNKHLKKYPNLERSLIQHEARHTRQSGMTKHDLIHDLTTMNQIHTWNMMKFMVRHPFSLVQFVPIYYTKKRGWIKDNNLILVYGVLAGIIGTGLLIGAVI